jgi:hypothetical protein
LEIRGVFDSKLLIFLSGLHKIAKRLLFVFHNITTVSQFFKVANWFVRERNSTKTHRYSSNIQSVNVQMHAEDEDIDKTLRTSITDIARGRLTISYF